MLVGLIPFRKGSQRVKDKNIRKINGIPLFEYSLMVALAVLDKVIVATDYTMEELLAAGPSSIKNDKVIYYPRVEVDEHQKANYYIQEQIDVGNVDWCDSIVLLQPTCPLRTIGHLQDAVGLYTMSGGAVDALTSCIELDSINKMYFQNDAGYWKSLSISQDYNRFKDKMVMYRNSSIYIFKVSTFLKRGDIWGDNRIMFPMELPYSIDIDSEADFKMAKMLINLGILDRGVDND